MNLIIRAGVVVGLLIIVVAAPSTVNASAECHPSSVACSDGQFDNYYVHNQGVAWLGNPKSGILKTGTIIRQYYQYGVLNRDLLGGPVIVANSGVDRIRHRMPFPRFVYTEPDNNHLFFSNTGFAVSFGLKEYYLSNGGIDRFGPAVSPEIEHDTQAGVSVQYFTRGRLEYVGAGGGNQAFVRIGEIGSELWEIEKKRVMPAKSPLQYGMQIHAFHATNHDQITWRVAVTDFGWIKHQVRWSEIEPSPGNFQWGELDAVVESANRYQMKTFLSVVSSPSWANPAGLDGLPANLADFSNFMNVLANRYNGRVAAYEIWNEPNLNLFWGQDPDPAAYGRLLERAYNSVKANDPNALIVFAGLAPTGGSIGLGMDDIEFLRASFIQTEGRISNYFDVIGVHSYGYRSSPAAIYDEWASRSGESFLDDPTFYFTHFREVRAVLEEYFSGSKSLWLTEFGWTTKNQSSDFSFGDYIDEQMQARYLVDALTLVERQYPYVGAMFVYNLNFRTLGRPGTSDHGFGILNEDFSPRPAYDALQAADKSFVSEVRRG